jgi:nitrogen fixation NifU-like protein
MELQRQDYVEFILDHFDNPRHRGLLADGDVTARGGFPDCGDVLEMSLKIDADGTVSGIGFEGEGCTLSMASASIVCETVLGRSRAEVDAVDEGCLRSALGHEMVESRPKCAGLSLEVLRTALNKYDRDRGGAAALRAGDHGAVAVERGGVS